MQGAYYAAVVYPEILVMILVMGYYHVALTQPPNSWRRVLTLGLLAAAIVQVRPVFLFFPLAQVAFDWLWTQREFRLPAAAGFLTLFGLTLLPYGFWNLQHHGVFKVTPLEGGGGVMQIGFWALRMPNYREQHYWTNTMGDEIVQFVDPRRRAPLHCRLQSGVGRHQPAVRTLPLAPRFGLRPDDAPGYSAPLPPPTAAPTPVSARSCW